jgi:hypothetical protein
MAKRKSGKKSTLDRFDSKTKSVSNRIVRATKRLQKSVRKLERHMDRIGNAFEDLYEAQSRAGL